MHIAVLDPQVERRIAAGEVIERPSSVVRELVDNAIDAIPSSITVTLKEGGISEIVVMDDGEGIAEEDLPLCCASHATSKVHTLDDLYHISSMGFRGEALYSISSVSVTTISSRMHSITVDNGKSGGVIQGGVEKGTKVTIRDLFLDIPARRQFLKRPSTEMMMCRNVLLEKALAYPSIVFRLVSDDTPVFTLEKSDRKGRVIDILSLSKAVSATEFRELSLDGGRFSLYAVASSPALYRSDRSGIRIFMNNRPVEEFSLVQAVSYGYGELLPGGCFPYCCLFVMDDPTLVDFNIHPTKREVRLRNKAEIHHGITMMITSQMKRNIPRMILEETSVQPALPSVNDGERHTFVSEHHPSSYRPTEERKPIDPSWFQKAKEVLGQTQGMVNEKTTEDQDTWMIQKEEERFTYIGQAFHLFLIAEKGDDLYLVDQHAAHERILFDAIRQKKDVQPLLVPLSFEVDSDVDEYLLSNVDIYLNLGIKLERKEAKEWNLLSVPALFKNIEGEVVSFIQKETGDGLEVEKGLYAIVACHKAIKQGDTIDRTTAIELLKKVFDLAEPACPHGRTFVIRMRKQELMQAVGRTL